MKSQLLCPKSRFQYASLLADAVIGQAATPFYRLQVVQSRSLLRLRECSDRTRQRFMVKPMIRVSDRYLRPPAQFDKPASLIFAFSLMSKAHAELASLSQSNL